MVLTKSFILNPTQIEITSVSIYLYLLQKRTKVFLKFIWLYCQFTSTYLQSTYIYNIGMMGCTYDACSLHFFSRIYRDRLEMTSAKQVGSGRSKHM